MAKTHTASSTITFARMALLKMQIRIALRRASEISKESLAAIEKGLDNRWISEVHIYGLNRSGLCRAQLSLEIDWAEHNLHLSEGRAKVTIDGSWVDNTAVEVDEAVDLFNKYAKQNMLSVKVTISYPSHLDRIYINRQLGFVPAEPIKWAGGVIGNYSKVPELSELKVGVKIVG